MGQPDNDSLKRFIRAIEPYDLAIIESFVEMVEERAEHNMERTGKLEGAHYAAMKSILTELKTGLDKKRNSVFHKETDRWY